MLLFLRADLIKKRTSRIKNNQSKNLIEKVFDGHLPTLYYAPPLSFEQKEVRVSR